MKAYKALHCVNYARIDAFWKDGRLIILEPNTLPGVTPSTHVFHQAADAGMNAMKFFDAVIEDAMRLHKEKIGPL